MLGDTNGDFKRKLLGKTEEKVRGYRSVALSHYCGNGYAFCVMISRKLGLGAWHEREAALCELDRRWRPAIEHWTLALVNPSVDRRSILLGRRAHAYGELSDWDHAEGDLNEALSKISGDSELLQARANARIHLSRPKNDRNKLDQNKLSEAISDYLQVLKTDKDNGLARAQLAAAYVESVQFKEALAEYDWAIDCTFPENP